MIMHGENVRWRRLWLVWRSNICILTGDRKEIENSY